MWVDSIYERVRYFPGWLFCLQMASGVSVFTLKKLENTKTNELFFLQCLYDFDILHLEHLQLKKKIF